LPIEDMVFWDEWKKKNPFHVPEGSELSTRGLRAQSVGG
jgi:hypothetical protein